MSRRTDRTVPPVPRTDPERSSWPPEATPPSRPRLDLSIAQVTGSVLAAVSATVVTSRFGVAGTVVGAAVASTVATVGTSLYAHFFRTGTTVLAASGARLLSGDRPHIPAVHGPRRRTLALVVAPLVVCAVALGSISALEAVTGRTLSGLIGWQRGDTTGTSIGQVARSLEGRGVAPVQHSRSIEPSGGPSSPTPSAAPTPSHTSKSPAPSTSAAATAPPSPQVSAPVTGTPAATGSPTPASPTAGAPRSPAGG